MDIKINGHDFKYDITSMAMLFFPGEKVYYVNRSSATLRARSILKVKDGKYFSYSSVFMGGKTFSSSKVAPLDYDIKNLVKQTFYIACQKATGITSPWGILTGIRPLSVYTKLINNGRCPQTILKNEYFLSDDKIKLLSLIYDAEAPYVKQDSKDVSVYISIPFCPSKCSYCSFISVSATNKTDLLSEYLDLLKEEIKSKSDLIKYFSLKVKSVYVGGGTPGILSEKQLKDLINVISDCFDVDELEEFCFEIGRPDTVTAEKIRILQNNKVSRICINTQTTNNDILTLVNRNHTFHDYKSSVSNTKKISTAVINTDLIAGLPNETSESFKKSIEDVIATDVENITVHTLAIKKSSVLADDLNNYKPVNDSVVSMLEYAYDRLLECGYIPYYIYRQKNCVSNGENIGFCKPDTIGKYNIYMMEDVHSVISCGAGASSKIIDGTKVDRIINVKYPMEYVREYYKVKNNTEKIRIKLKELNEYE